MFHHKRNKNSRRTPNPSSWLPHFHAWLSTPATAVMPLLVNPVRTDSRNCMSGAVLQPWRTWWLRSLLHWTPGSEEGAFDAATVWLRQQRIFLQYRRPGFNPWIRKILWRREWQPTAVFLPGESHDGQRSLVGYSPWVTKRTTWLSYWHFHFFRFSLSFPLQDSDLFSPLSSFTQNSKSLLPFSFFFFK